MTRVPWSEVDPLDAVLLDELVAQAVGRNLDALAPAVENLGQVPLGVDLDFVVMGRIALRDLRHDLDRLAGGQQAVHAGGADADALLAAAHPQAVELRAVEQLAEDQGDLLLEDARPVVLHADLEAVRADALDVDPDFGQDAGLFAGVQGVVDGLLDGGQQGLARVVEAQQVAVLGEELADGDVALAGGHRLGGGPAAQPRRRGAVAAGRAAVGIGRGGGLHFRGRTNGQSWGSSLKRSIDKPTRIIPILPAASHTVFLEFPAYCGAFSHPAYKDSPLRPSLAEIGTEPFRSCFRTRSEAAPQP